MTCVARTVQSALASLALCVFAPAALDAQQQGATGAQSRDSLAMPQDTVIPPRLTNMREVSRTLDEAYPVSLQRRGIGGMARMRLFIDEEGAPDTVSLRASTGLTGLDGAARRTAQTARFRPATIGGEPIGAWVDFNVQFEGEDHARSLPSVISVPERSTLKNSLHAFYPPDLRRAQIGTSVGLSLVVDAAGSVIDQDIVDPSCFDAANQAAADVTRSIPFEPDSGTSGRWTFATVTFNTDSVRLKLFGDTMTRDTTTKAPRDPDRPPGQPGAAPEQPADRVAGARETLSQAAARQGHRRIGRGPLPGPRGWARRIQDGLGEQRILRAGHGRDRGRTGYAFRPGHDR